MNRIWKRRWLDCCHTHAFSSCAFSLQYFFLWDKWAKIVLKKCSSPGLDSIHLPTSSFTPLWDWMAFILPTEYCFIWLRLVFAYVRYFILFNYCLSQFKIQYFFVLYTCITLLIYSAVCMCVTTPLQIWYFGKVLHAENDFMFWMDISLFVLNE